MCCGRYTYITTPEIMDLLEIENDDFELQPNYNASPGQNLPMITMNSPKRIGLMRWGLIPFWAKDPRKVYRTINARSEEISQKPTFRGPLKNKHCLIPASGFFEWDKKGKEKIPNYFRLKNREIFAIAGLYDQWKDPSGAEIFSYTILTTRANGVVGKIHDRMPIILSRDAEEIRPDNSNYSPGELQQLLHPYADGEMIMYRVSRAVNSPTINKPELLDILSDN